MHYIHVYVPGDANGHIFDCDLHAYRYCFYIVTSFINCVLTAF
jgi:hypothetical protein